MAMVNRALYAETLKLKRTLAVWMAVLTPAALTLLSTAAAYQRKGNWIPVDANPWLYIFEEIMVYWAVLVLPLFITLETALLGQIEHSNNGWKVLYTQPVPRWASLAAKQIWGVGLVGLGTAALCGLTAVGGLLLGWARPALGLMGDIPWLEIGKQAGMVTLAAGLILGVHSWVAIRFRSFAATSALGIGMTIGGIILIGLDWVEYFPWSMPSTTLYNYYQGLEVQSMVIMGFVGWVVLSVAGIFRLRRLEL